MNQLPKSLMEAKYLDNICLLGKKYLKEFGINGKMLEIGGYPFYPQSNIIFWEVKEYNNLEFKTEGNKETIIGDITNCPQIKDETYDFIYSMDTFEHIAEPWLAAKEMIRILKPGGIVFVVTLFSWRYHPCPIDYFRFTPHALAFLFKDLELIEANWDGIQRRKNHRGEIGKDDEVPIDKFAIWCQDADDKPKHEELAIAGFLENWRVYYVGKKEAI